jgi:hypothetical protein
VAGGLRPRRVVMLRHMLPMADHNGGLPPLAGHRGYAARVTVAGGRDGAAVPTPAAAGSRWWSAADGRCTRRSSGRSRRAPGRGWTSP